MPTRFPALLQAAGEDDATQLAHVNSCVNWIVKKQLQRVPELNLLHTQHDCPSYLVNLSRGHCGESQEATDMQAQPLFALYLPASSHSKLCTHIHSRFRFKYPSFRYLSFFSVFLASSLNLLHRHKAALKRITHAVKTLRISTDN